MTRDFDRQVTEIQIRIAVFNRSRNTRHRDRGINPPAKGEVPSDPDL